MRVCIHIPTGRLIESQSNDAAPLDALISNALAAGYAADAIDAKVIGEAEYQALLHPAPTLPEAQSKAILAATAACDAILAPFGAEYGTWETATWDQQYSEALAYTASTTANVPLLSAMCVARGISIAELAGKIINNRAAWVSLTGYVIGQRQRIVGLIEAATTIEEVESVDMTISLP